MPKRSSCVGWHPTPWAHAVHPARCSRSPLRLLFASAPVGSPEIPECCKARCRYKSEKKHQLRFYLDLTHTGFVILHVNTWKYCRKYWSGSRRFDLFVPTALNKMAMLTEGSTTTVYACFSRQQLCNINEVSFWEIITNRGLRTWLQYMPRVDLLLAGVFVLVSSVICPRHHCPRWIFASYFISHKIGP